MALPEFGNQSCPEPFVILRTGHAEVWRATFRPKAAVDPARLLVDRGARRHVVEI